MSLSFGLAVGMLADVVSVGVIVINKACVWYIKICCKRL